MLTFTVLVEAEAPVEEAASLLVEPRPVLDADAEDRLLVGISDVGLAKVCSVLEEEMRLDDEEVSTLVERSEVLLPEASVAELDAWSLLERLVVGDDDVGRVDGELVS